MKHTRLIVIVIFIAIIAFVLVRYAYERRKRRKRHEEAVYTIIMDNTVLVAVGAAALLVIVLFAGFDFDKEDLIDYKAIATVIMTGIFGLLIMVWRNHKINRLEDAIKLSQDYEALLSTYSAETEKDRWYKHDNSGMDENNIYALMPKEREHLAGDGYVVKFPVVIDADLQNRQICIDDSKEMYQLPQEIKGFETELFKSHDTSHLYNQLNVRVNDWELLGDDFIIHTGRTTYFYSMVTNRAMDYRLSNEMTARSILQYGPFVPPLRESRLSNHLGFNGFIITSDRKIPLVKRKGNLSIGKDTYGPSVGASLKTKYCLDENMHFTFEGLLNGIRKEMQDELKLTKDVTDGFNGEYIICAYRDIVEGNKPQLLFYYPVDLSEPEITSVFKKELMKKKKILRKSGTVETEEAEDGTKLRWLSLDDLDSILYTQHSIIYKGTEYPSVPSATVSLLIVKDYLERIHF